MQIENEEEKAVLESGLDETLLELATLRDGQNEQSSVLQGRIDAMSSTHKRKLQQILGKSLFLIIYLFVLNLDTYQIRYFFFSNRLHLGDLY